MAESKAKAGNRILKLLQHAGVDVPEEQAIRLRADGVATICPSRQGLEARFVAVHLAAVVVFHGATEACHRETSWVSACLTRAPSTLACGFMCCPVPSPKTLQEENFWYLFAAYSTIWTALCVYMFRLSQKNKELQAELRALQAQIEKALTR